MKGRLLVVRYIPHVPNNEHVVKTSFPVDQYEKVLLRLFSLYPLIEVVQVYCVLLGNEHKDNSRVDTHVPSIANICTSAGDEAIDEWLEARKDL